jgi:predicted glycoside hydrolase/deacetylase ChbG (UPF0249 family)
MQRPVIGARMNEHSMLEGKGVIVCADDFCVNASASEGIVELAAMGRISATSVMVLSDRWPQDVRLLDPLRGAIDVGLHLDWTSEFAFATGHGMSLGAAMRRALLGGFERHLVASIIERQLDLFEAKWNAPPDYVDGHQHIQQFSGIREALVDVLVRRYAGVNRKPYLRISRPHRSMKDIKSRVISIMGADALENIAVGAGIGCTTTLLGAYDFSGGGIRFARLMTRWLELIPPGGVIMCHPAQASEPSDEIGSARLQEFLYLGGDGFLTALRRANVRIARR